MEDGCGEPRPRLVHNEDAPPRGATGRLGSVRWGSAAAAAVGAVGADDRADHELAGAARRGATARGAGVAGGLGRTRVARALVVTLVRGLVVRGGGVATLTARGLLTAGALRR